MKRTKIMRLITLALAMLLSALMLLAAPVSSLWAEQTVTAPLEPYSARYSIYRNGKLIGKAEVLVTQQGDRWMLKSDSRGTHGLARLLGFRDTEQVIGTVEDGDFLPHQYIHNMRVAGMDRKWIGEFDYEQGQIRITENDDDTLELDFTPGALDPLSMKLKMRRELDQAHAIDGEHQLSYLMVEEDKLDIQKFRILPNEWMETSLGCLETIPMEKIRNSKTRYTRAWHAPELNNIEVRMEHGKTDGDHYELRITELELGGQLIQPMPGCASMQRTPPPS